MLASLSNQHPNLKGKEIMTGAQQLRRIERLEIAKNRLAKGLSITLIKEATKLSEIINKPKNLR